MRRPRLSVFGLLLALSMVLPAVPTLAAPGDSAAAAAACQNGGYLAWTDADGRPFRNAGQCVRYVANGNTLVERVLDLAIHNGLGNPDDLGNVEFDGFITGTGFTPDSRIVVLSATFAPSGVVHDLIYVLDAPPAPDIATIPTDQDGAFETIPFFAFCWDTTTENTAVTITAADAAGVSYTEMFSLSCASRSVDPNWLISIEAVPDPASDPLSCFAVVNIYGFAPGTYPITLRISGPGTDPMVTVVEGTVVADDIGTGRYQTSASYLPGTVVHVTIDIADFNDHILPCEATP